jgi:hypothetical protein
VPPSAAETARPVGVILAVERTRSASRCRAWSTPGSPRMAASSVPSAWRISVRRAGVIGGGAGQRYRTRAQSGSAATAASVMSCHSPAISSSIPGGSSSQSSSPAPAGVPRSCGRTAVTYRPKPAASDGIMPRGTPASSAAAVISLTYRSAARAGSGVPTNPMAASGIHQGRVHPQQQRRGGSRVAQPGHRVHAADMRVDRPDPLRGPPGGIPVAVGDGCHVAGRGGEPADRVGPPAAVLVDAGHHQRVQGLHQQRAQARGRCRQVGADLPGDAGRTEEPVI